MFYLFSDTILPLLIVGIIVVVVVCTRKRNGSSNINPMPPNNPKNQNHYYADSNGDYMPAPSMQQPPARTTNICHHCGGSNALNDRFCGFCGSVLPDVQRPQLQQNYNIVPPQNSNNNYFPPNHVSRPNPYSRRRTSSGKVVLITFSVILAFVLIIVASVNSCSPGCQYPDYVVYCDITNSYNYSSINFENYYSNISYQIEQDNGLYCYYTDYNYGSSYDEKTVSLKVTQNTGAYLVIESYINQGSAQAVMYLPDSSATHYDYYSNKHYSYASDAYYTSPYQKSLTCYDLSDYMGEYINLDFYFYDASGNISVYLTTYEYYSKDYLTSLRAPTIETYCDLSSNQITAKNYTSSTSYSFGYNNDNYSYSSSADEKTLVFTPTTYNKYLVITYSLSDGEATSLFYFKNENQNSYDRYGNKYYGANTDSYYFYRNSTVYYTYYDNVCFDLSDYIGQEVAIDFYFNNASGNVSFYLTNYEYYNLYYLNNLHAPKTSEPSCELKSNEIIVKNHTTATSFTGGPNYDNYPTLSWADEKIVMFTPTVDFPYLTMFHSFTSGEVLVVVYLNSEYIPTYDSKGFKYFRSETMSYGFYTNSTDYNINYDSLCLDFSNYAGQEIVMEFYFKNASGTIFWTDSSYAPNPSTRVTNLYTAQRSEPLPCDNGIEDGMHCYTLTNCTSNASYSTNSYSYSVGTAPYKTNENAMWFSPFGNYTHIYIKNKLTSGSARLVFYIYDESKVTVDAKQVKHYNFTIETIDLYLGQFESIDLDLSKYADYTIALDFYFENACGKIFLDRATHSTTTNTIVADFS